MKHILNCDISAAVPVRGPGKDGFGYNSVGKSLQLIISQGEFL